MSYEGHIQQLCVDGHYNVIDVYDHNTMICVECGLEIVWENSVDTTNCDSVGELDIEVFRIKGTGPLHQTLRRYRIPTAQETFKYRQMYAMEAK